MGKRATRRQTLQAMTTGVSGLSPGSAGQLDPGTPQIQAFDAIATAAARLRSAVTSEDVPLPIVCLPVDEPAAAASP